MRPVSILGDKVLCTCFCRGHRCPDGVTVRGSKDTFIMGSGVVRLGDVATNCCGSCCRCPNVVLVGSKHTFVNNKPVARVGDRVTCGVILSSRNNQVFSS